MTQKPTDKVQPSPENPTPDDAASDTLGMHLKKARLSQHKTLEEAAKTIRIHADSLEALEEDDRSKLPAEVFTRGFIKIYAQYLGLDPQEALYWYDRRDRHQWIDSTEKINAQELLASESLAESPTTITGKHIFLMVTVIVVFFLAYLGYKTYTSLPVSPDTRIKTDGGKGLPALTAAPGESPTEQKESSETPAGPVIDADELQQQDREQPPSTSQKTITPKEVIPSPEPEEVTDASSVVPPIVAPTEENATESESPEASRETEFNYVLKASFSEQTWLRISIDDQPPREFTYNPDEEETWNAHEKIDLLVGNAGGINFTLNGEPLPQLGKSGKVHRLVIPKAASD